MKILSIGVLIFALTNAQVVFAQNLNLVRVAKSWLESNRYDPISKVYYLEGHKNPYLSTEAKSVYYWDYWCAGFVGQIALEANGTPDKQFVAAAPSLDVPSDVVPYDRKRDTADKIGAKRAFSLMEEAGRVRKDFSNITAGAAVFWTGGLEFGHVAIFTGEKDNQGELLIITTGWPSRPGTRMRTLQELIKDIGEPAGWVEI